MVRIAEIGARPGHGHKPEQQTGGGKRGKDQEDGAMSEEKRAKHDADGDETEKYTCNHTEISLLGRTPVSDTTSARPERNMRLPDGHYIPNRA